MNDIGDDVDFVNVGDDVDIGDVDSIFGGVAPVLLAHPAPHEGGARVTSRPTRQTHCGPCGLSTCKAACSSSDRRCIRNGSHFGLGLV